ncbi:MAG: hypothetical protein CMJ12_00690 [Pelagibacterales bacterium]|nr:hypothetical protein [Pelagibacterales bacterium]
MTKLIRFYIIIFFLISSKTLVAADMSGYLLNQAIKEFNNKNYEVAYKSLSNIAPAGNPVATYLLAQMYLKGLGIEINNKNAYEMILYSAERLFSHDKALALESQITLSNMYKEGIGTKVSNEKAYMWAFIARKTNEEMHLNYLKELQNQLTPEEINDFEKKGLKIFKNSIKK